MSLVLVIEDEAVLRAAIVRGLARMPGVEVVGAGTFADATALLREATPDLIISDIELPDGSGIEILPFLENRGMSAPIVFMSAYMARYRADVPPSPMIEAYEKPIPLETLRELVRRHTSGDTAIDAPPPFSVLDYIQLACWSRRSIRITVPTEGTVGHLIVNDGIIWSATDEAGSGPPALRRLVFAAQPNATVSKLSGDPGERNILGEPQSVMVELAEYRHAINQALADKTRASDFDTVATDAASDLDAGIAANSTPVEGTGVLVGRHADTLRAHSAAEFPEDGAGSAPSFDSFDHAQGDITPEPEPEPEPLSPTMQHFEALKAEGIDALLARDYDAAEASFRAAQEFVAGDAIVEANLERLAQIRETLAGDDT